MIRLGWFGSAMVAATFAVIAACDQVSVTTPAPAAMEVQPSGLTITVGQRSQLSAVIRDANGNQLGGQPISWSSSDGAVASITSAGEVEGMSVGSSTITATSGSASATTLVTVRSSAGFDLDRTAVAFTTGTNGSAGPQTVLISASGASPATGLTLSVVYGTGASGWLNAGLSNTTSPSSATLSADAQGLSLGTYTATVSISSDDAPAQTISVSLQVTDAPAIGVSRNSIQFDAPEGGSAPPSQTVDVSNVGGGTLTGLSTTVRYGSGQTTGWLQATLQGTQAPTSLVLGAQTGNLTAGTYTATVLISATGAANTPVSLDVTLVVNSNTQQPRISLSDTVVTFAGAQGVADPPAQVLTVSNSGVATLNGLATAVSYASGQPTGWLSATLSSAVAPASLTLDASVGSLAAGTYQASVEVVAGGASNSPRFVTVVLTVNGSPTIGLSPTSVSFNAPASGADPAAQTVSISNLGGGLVSGLDGSVSYQGGVTGWLTTSLSGTTAPATLTLNATTGSLATGSYSATVTITSSTAANSPITLPVTFAVGATSAGISVSPATLTFAAIRGGSAPAAQTVNVTNTGGQPLTGLTASVGSHSSGSGWLSATLSGTTAPATLSIRPQNSLPTTAGPHTAVVSVSSPVAGNSPQTIDVTVEVPQVSVAPSSDAISVPTGGSGSTSATVSNAGTGTLTGLTASVDYTSGSGWLTPTFTGNTLNLTASAAGIATPGTFTATVTVLANEDVIGDDITITMTVFSPPVIAAAPTSVTLDDSGPTSQPATGSIAVTNSGGGGAGALTGLTASVAGGASSWLTASLSGTTSPATVNLTATPGSLTGGTYNATVQIASTASGVTNSPLSVPVTFTVAPRPSITVSPSTATFSTWQNGPNPAGASVAISNGGDGTLSGLSVATSSGASWLTATLNGTTAPATVSLSASAAGLAAGSYSATVTVSSSATRVQNSPQVINVTFTVAPAPAISLSPSSRTFSAFAGTASPPAQTVTVGNGGGGSLTGLSMDSIQYVSGTGGWLVASLAGSSAPATLTLNATTGSLAINTYTARVWISSTTQGVSNSPQAVDVTFNVQTPPTLVLSAAPGAQQVVESPGAPSSAAAAVNVTGLGGTTVTGLATSISYTSGAGWLTANLTGTSTPATINLTSSAGPLGAGTYVATVTVTSPIAGNSPQSFQVTMVVAPAPAIQLSQAGIMVFGALAGSTPPSQPVTVTNVGGGGAAGLTGLAAGIQYLTPGPGVDPSCTGTASGWLNAPLSSTASPSTMSVSPSATSLAAGASYCARVTVTSPVARNTSQDFIVRIGVS